MFILNLLIFFIVLGVLITIHEFGHFYFAKKAGVLCHEFAIGMGPIIYSKEKNETKYSIRALPLGGFVSMAGEMSEDSPLIMGSNIGLKFNSEGLVKFISNEGIKADITGKLINFDLFGKDLSPLFIEIEVDAEVKRYEVLRNAKYELKENSFMYIEPEEKSFNGKTLWQRFITIFAGPLFNFIFALFIYLIVALFVHKPISNTTKIGKVGTDMPAYLAGVREEDVITHVNGQAVNNFSDISEAIQNGTSKVIFTIDGTDHIIDAAVAIQRIGISNFSKDKVVEKDKTLVKSISGKSAGKLKIDDEITKIDDTLISSWDDIIVFFRNIGDDENIKEVTVTYIRENKTEEVVIELLPIKTLRKLNASDVQISTGITMQTKFNFGYFILYPFKKFGSDIVQMGTTLGLLFGRNTGVGVSDLSGFVGIFSMVSQSASAGFLSLLVFMAFISINLGFLNLLPIPALDGGRIVFLAYELITGKRPNKKAESIMITVTMFLLFGLMIYVTWADILRLFQGVF